MPVAPRPLLLTADPALLDELLRLAALAGVEVQVAADPGAAGAAWESAPLVLLGPDAAARRPGRRRPGVVLVTAAEDPAVWELAVAAGAERVAVLPAAEPAVRDLLADAGEPQVAAGRAVGVVGGRGGAGASTLAAALALTAARAGQRAILLDGDPLGGGLDLVLGAEAAPGLRWPDLAGSRGRLPAGVLDGALPEVEGVRLLAQARGGGLEVTAEAAAAVAAAARRGADLVVVDLPRRLDPAAAALAAGLDLALLVVPCELRAAAGAVEVARRLSASCADLRLVLRGPAPAGLRPDDVARLVPYPVAVALRPQPRLAQAAERGEPPAGRGPLAGACLELLAQLRPAEQVA